MKSMRRYLCRFGGVARQPLFALVLFGASGCEGGDASSDACATYACVNDLHLDGSVTIASDVTDVDIQFCIEGKCNTSSFDLKALGGEACMRGDDGSTVCLSETAAPATFKLTSAIFYDYSSQPHDLTVEITITDQVSGDVLLNETRSATARITREDNCHRCWTAEASL